MRSIHMCKNIRKMRSYSQLIRWFVLKMICSFIPVALRSQFQGARILAIKIPNGLRKLFEGLGEDLNSTHFGTVVKLYGD
jgi:hypothetical protein